jgi:hypothetical protein
MVRHLVSTAAARFLGRYQQQLVRLQERYQVQQGHSQVRYQRQQVLLLALYLPPPEHSQARLQLLLLMR